MEVKSVRKIEVDLKNHQLSKKVLKIQLIYFWFNLGRVLPHAIITIYMLTKGLNISEIAIVQASYMFGSIIMEFPSGILSDYWSRKYVYVLGVSLIIGAYCLIPMATSLLIFSILWFIYGIGASFITGTIDNDMILNLKATENDEHIPIITTKFQQSFFASALIGGAIGSILYTIIGFKIYFLASFLMFISILITISYQEYDNQLPNNDFNLKLFVQQITENSEYLLALLIMLSLTIFTTVFYQYWQILFAFKEVNIIYFGFFYTIFQLSGLLVGKLYLNFYQQDNYLKINYCLFLITGLLSFVFSGILFTITFSLFISFFYAISYYCLNIYKQELTILNISANTSFVGLLSSLTSLIILLIIAIFNFLMTINQIFLIITLLFLLINYSLIKQKQ